MDLSGISWTDVLILSCEVDLRQITDLVECCHKAGVVVEGRHDQGVVLLMDVQGGLNVHFGVLEETDIFGTITTYLYDLPAFFLITDFTFYTFTTLTFLLTAQILD